MSTPPAGANPLRFGDFEVVRELARTPPLGVYEARDGDKTCVLRALRMGEDATTEQRVAFRRAATAAASVRHHGFGRVLGVHDGADPEGAAEVTYAVVEHIDGPLLAEWVGDRPPSIRRVLRLMSRVIRAVEAAHAVDVVHGALAPDRIRVPSSRGPRILGLELRRGSVPQLPTSPWPADAFAAPEVSAARDRAPSSSADIYSLGALLFFTLAARLPGEGSSLIELRPEVHPDLAAIAAKASHPDPQRRYPSAAALHEDLQHFREGIATTTASGATRRPSTRTGGTDRSAPAATTAPAPATPAEAGAIPSRGRGRGVGLGAVTFVLGLAVGAIAVSIGTARPKTDAPGGTTATTSGAGDGGTTATPPDPAVLAAERRQLAEAAERAASDPRGAADAIAGIADRPETGAARAAALLAIGRARLDAARAAEDLPPAEESLGLAFALDPGGDAGDRALLLLARARLRAGDPTGAGQLLARVGAPPGSVAGRARRRLAATVALARGQLAEASRLLGPTEPAGDGSDEIADLVGAEGARPRPVGAWANVLAALGPGSTIEGPPAPVSGIALVPTDPPALAIAHGDVLVTRRFGGPDGAVRIERVASAGGTIEALAAGDVGGDGRVEVAFIERAADGRRRLVVADAGDPSSTPALLRVLGRQEQPASVTIGDLDGDRRADVLVGLGAPTGGARAFLVAGGGPDDGADATTTEKAISEEGPARAVAIILAESGAGTAVISVGPTPAVTRAYALEPTTGLFAARALDPAPPPGAVAILRTDAGARVLVAAGPADAAPPPGDDGDGDAAPARREPVLEIHAPQPTGPGKGAWRRERRLVLPASVEAVESLAVGRPAGEAGPLVAAVGARDAAGARFVLLVLLEPALEGSGEAASTVSIAGRAPCLFADVDGDGRDELVLGGDVATVHGVSSSSDAGGGAGEVETDGPVSALAEDPARRRLAAAEALLACGLPLAARRVATSFGPVEHREPDLRAAIALLELRALAAAGDRAALRSAAEARSRELPAIAGDAALFVALAEAAAGERSARAWSTVGRLGASIAPPPSRVPAPIVDRTVILEAAGAAGAVPWEANVPLRFRRDRGAALSVRHPVLDPATGAAPAALATRVHGAGEPFAIRVGFRGADPGAVPRTLIGFVDAPSVAAAVAAAAPGDLPEPLVGLELRPSGGRRLLVIARLAGGEQRALGPLPMDRAFEATLTADPRRGTASLRVEPEGARPLRTALPAVAVHDAVFGVFSATSDPAPPPFVPPVPEAAGGIRLDRIELATSRGSRARVAAGAETDASLGARGLAALGLESDTERTLRLVERALAENPLDPLARLARALRRDAAPEEAGLDAAAAVAGDPENAVPALYAASRLGGPDLVEAALGQAARDLPAHPDPVAAARTALRAGEPSSALVRLAADESVAGLIVAARALSIVGATREALRVAQEAVTRAPANAEALAARGLIRLRLGRCADAARDLDTAIRRSAAEEHPDWVLARGRASAGAGRPAAATRDLEMAVRLLGPRQPADLERWVAEWKRRRKSRRSNR